MEQLTLSKAEQNCLQIEAMVKNLYMNFLELGGLLVENQEQGFWGASGFESFKDFVQHLGIGYSWATRLMGLAKVVAQQLLTKEEMIEIGVAKACLLLPHMKDGKLDEAVKLLARDCTWNDLRKELGHNIKDPEPPKEYVICPRCGGEVQPLQVVCHCGQRFQLYSGMIRRR